MSFVSDFKADLDDIRTEVPSDIGLRTATLVVRTVRLVGDMLTGGSSSATDTPIRSPVGDRYKVKIVATKDVVASGGLYQNGALRVGPITPPYAGGGFTKNDLIPPSVPGQEVYYGVTDQTGQTQWCQMASSDTVNDLHWFIVLNPTGTTPRAPS